MSDAKEEKDSPKPIIIKNTTDLQRLKLEKLMKNPDKPVLIPERPKSKGVPVVPDFVRNVMGSSAGAGSGEFHVYRHLRRKEYARQKFMTERAETERKDEEYRKKLDENKRLADEKTAKKRAKRLKKKKLKGKQKKIKLDASESESNDDSDSDNNSASKTSDSEEQKIITNNTTVNSSTVEVNIETNLKIEKDDNVCEKEIKQRSESQQTTDENCCKTNDIVQSDET